MEDLNAVKTTDLRKMAAELGIRGMSSGRKADLIAAIAKAQEFNATFVSAEGQNRTAADTVAERNRLIELTGDKAALEAEEELREAAREHDAAAEEISAKLTVVNPVDELLDVDEAGRNAHRATPVTAKSGKTAYVAIYVNGDFRVHGAKCKDIAKDKAASDSRPYRYPASATQTSIAADLYSDFIPDEMTVEDAIDQITFLPCCPAMDLTADKFLDQLKSGDRVADAANAGNKAAAKKSAAKKGKEVLGEVVMNGKAVTHPKAAQFVRDAVNAGWTFGSVTTNGTITEVIVSRVGGEWVRISWDGKACQNGTEHKATDGKVRKVRNASAARAVLAS